ncbi:glycosyltransferase family 2 protein [Fusobacterium pseudoperiodonticum]|uniref:glycosyltransferase family 2 protein n=1 Tax=Fusobacterium pseudoperiodonticum TaxID=2663009 RepID=UPI0021F2A857|nr:glycosyltransferase family A protein [Fusobacterium pseudoperiodonticum]
MEIDNNIFISVIVPIYNAENFLPRCIESVLDQTFKNFELLLINDGSKDSSLDICNKYLEKFPDKIKVFNNKNIGL